jgi:hypothetical protein
MTDIVERLREQIMADHARGCQGRQYTCNCGHDLKTEGLLDLAADEIERLQAALRLYYEAPCPICSGDCGSANPPVIGCPVLEARRALGGDSYD